MSKSTQLISICFTVNKYMYSMMCRMDRIQFWFWFDVNRSTFEEDMCRKRYFHFRSRWPWPLTFRPQICSPSYSCPAICSTKLEVPTVFPCLRENQRHGTDGQTNGVQRLIRPTIMDGRKIKHSVKPYLYEWLATARVCLYTWLKGLLGSSRRTVLTKHM